MDQPRYVNLSPDGQHRPLPQEMRSDGRPVWEPPVLDYFDLIGEEYERKREALLKYTNNDKKLTTSILDRMAECQLSVMYSDWACTNAPESSPFFHNLRGEILTDMREIEDECRRVGDIGVVLERGEDGSYTAISTDEYREKELHRQRAPIWEFAPVVLEGNAQTAEADSSPREEEGATTDDCIAQSQNPKIVLEDDDIDRTRLSDEDEDTRRAKRQKVKSHQESGRCAAM